MADQGLHFEQILGFCPSRRINEEPESVVAPSATKMQETLNKMPAASVYLLEKAHLLPFFVAFSRRDESIILKGGNVYLINLQ